MRFRPWLLLTALTVVNALPAGAAYRVIYRFQGHADGEAPSQLISDAQGNLYGVTQYGGLGACAFSGEKGCGTVFELSPPTAGQTAWTETVLYAFAGGSDGAYPNSLAFDRSGNLYGVTASGGTGGCLVYGESGCGTAYRLAPPSAPGTAWTETVLYRFLGGSNGWLPVTAILDAAGNLDGVAYYGGSVSRCGKGGCGTVFQLSPAASGRPWTETTLYAFRGTPGGGPHSGDGAQPQSLTMDNTGTLYGTTAWGGHCDGQAGCDGAAFQLTPPSSPGAAWTEKIVYRFLTGAAQPLSGFVFDPKGNLYGTAYQDVFELSATGQSVLYRFPHKSIAEPFGNVIFDASGNLWGTTCGSGPAGNGTVYELSPPSAGSGHWTHSALHNFAGGRDGECSTASLVSPQPGVYYGTTLRGGNQKCKAFSGDAVGCGIVFEVDNTH
jgi:uncharacterized repeat protein (TIGR03803 family)